MEEIGKPKYSLRPEGELKIENMIATHITKKQKRKLINLRYRMRIAGYEFNDSALICILPLKQKRRSIRRENVLKQFGYSLQNRLL